MNAINAMNCRAAETAIQQSLDVPLTGPERVRLDAHLQGCPACRSAWEGYRRLASVAEDWVRRPSPAETPPAEFTAQVLARLQTRPATAPLRPRLSAVGVTVALLAAVSPLAAPWLPAFPAWRTGWAADTLHTSGLWAAAQGVLTVRWAALLLLPALAANALFVLRARRTA